MYADPPLKLTFAQSPETAVIDTFRFFGTFLLFAFVDAFRYTFADDAVTFAAIDALAGAGMLHTKNTAANTTEIVRAIFRKSILVSTLSVSFSRIHFHYITK